MRFFVVFPLICAIAAFVLSMLCLFAGSKPNFMQDFDIITLNTSSLGQDVSSASSESQYSPNSIRSWIRDVSDDMESEFDDIRDDLTDTLAEKLGIHQWYSLHMTDMCMGTYMPEATDERASKNVSSCTNMTAMYHFDPTSELEEELASGPLGGRLALDDLGYSDDIQNGIRALNIAMSAMFVLYCIGIAAAGLSILVSLTSFCFTGRIVSLLNLLLAILAFLSLGISSGIVTAIMVKVVDLINEHGNEIGLFAYKGRKYLAMTWAATGVMLVAIVAWIAIFCMGRKHTRRRTVVEKPI